MSRRFYAMPRFEMSRALRGGWMVYEEDGRTLEFRWQMPGSTGQHILLAPLNLNRWTTPAADPVPLSKQLEILVQLRGWLNHQQVTSDIDRPQASNGGQPCAWAECTRPRLQGVAHCASHFDTTLLARET